MTRCDIIVALAALALACGGGSGDAGDAGPDSGPPADAVVDAGRTGACAKFDTPLMTADSLPVTMTGDVSAGGADLVVDGQSCEVEEAPFGVETPGPERVMRVTGLEPGVDYAVRLRSTADLAFYVARDCSGETGPGEGECMLFVDGSTGNEEVGAFTAAGSSAYIVVDHYQSEPPDDGAFTLEVYPSECTGDAQCAAPTPSCVDYRCVACSSSFECADPLKPVCDPGSGSCVPGSELCVGDDPPPREQGDDGPAGATDITPGAGTMEMVTGRICNAPQGELDFYAFDVTENGTHYTVTLDWPSAVDLDLEVYDADGNTVGLSLYESPEVIELTYLPTGTYFAEVNYYSSAPTTTSVDYTLSVERTIGDTCTTAADCAATYRNQLFRGNCADGACSWIEAGERAASASCDSSSDCASEVCTSFFFAADADERSVCTERCTSDAACAPLGADYVCTTYAEENFCTRKCLVDEHCPALLTVIPTAPPWYRLRCDVPSGQCVF